MQTLRPLMTRDNSTLAADIGKAMKSAVERAGFVAVQVRQEKQDGRTHIDLVANCPCGLGTSGFTYVLADHDIVYMNKFIAHQIGEQIYHAAVQHIEKDRAEGRWA